MMKESSTVFALALAPARALAPACSPSCSSSSEPELGKPRARPVPRREHGVEGEPLCRGARRAPKRWKGEKEVRKKRRGCRPPLSFSFSSSPSSSQNPALNKTPPPLLPANTDLLHDRRLGEAPCQVLLQRLLLERLVGLEDVLPPGVAGGARVGEDLGAEDEVSRERRRRRHPGEKATTTAAAAAAARAGKGLGAAGEGCCFCCVVPLF